MATGEIAGGFLIHTIGSRGGRNVKSFNAKEKQIRRIASWLPRLADAATASVAAEALFQIAITGDLESPSRNATRDELDEAALAPYRQAVDRLSNLEALIPEWVDRLVESVRSAAAYQLDLQVAISAGTDVPEIDMAGILTTQQLLRALQAVGERLDGHIDPLLTELEVADRDNTEKISEAIAYAGPALSRATPILLDRLRLHHIWCWPSAIGKAIKRAAAYDDRVMAGLRGMLCDDDAEVRRSAMDVLALLGERGRAAASQLVVFNGGDEQERCSMLFALGSQGDASPAVLDVLEAAISDASGYVRRAAAHALGNLTPEPTRFVPLLISACGYTEYLHDESLPEAAVRALERYGPAARIALPRLMQFITGPIADRVVPPDLVKEAVAAIAGQSLSIDVLDPPATHRDTPLLADEPLFAVMHRGRQCYIDRHGQITIETGFSYGEQFHGRRAIVHSEEGLTAVIDRSGRVVFESSWDEIRPFSEGLAAVKKAQKWGFVDENGRVVVEPQYDSVTRFSEGMAGVELGRTCLQVNDVVTFDRPGRRGFIDRSGTVVVPMNHHDVQPFSEARAAVCTSLMMKPNDLLAGQKVASDHKYGYMDQSGRVGIEGVYSTAAPFREGVAAVTLGQPFGRSRCGYIDRDGDIIIPLMYTSVSSFRDGVAVVSRRGKRHRSISTVIDRTGRTVLETSLQLDGGFSEGLAAAWSGDAWGVVDLAGRWVINPQFDQIEPFRHGVAAVKRGDWSGLIDISGRFIWGPTVEHCCDIRVIEGEWT